MTIERFTEIFDDTKSSWEGDNAFKGLVILSKYTDNLIHGADHDIIYGPNIEVLIKSGITDEDVESLAKLNWMIQDEYLTCYV